MTRKNFSFLIFCTGLTALFITLGIWQIQRLHRKENLIRQYQERQTAEPISLSAIDDAANKEKWNQRRITVTGQYFVAVKDNGSPGDLNLYLENKVLNGQVGYYVLTPLSLPDEKGNYAAQSGEGIYGYSTALINRGWIPKDQRGNVKLPPETVTIEGIIHYPPAQKPLYVPVNEINYGDAETHLFWIDLYEIMGQCCGSDVGSQYPFYIDLISSTSAATGQPVPVNETENLPNNHLQYAITWFALALITIVMSCIYQRKSKDL